MLSRFAQQLRQLGNIRRDTPSLVAREQANADRRHDGFHLFCGSTRNGPIAITRQLRSRLLQLARALSIAACSLRAPKARPGFQRHIPDRVKCPGAPPNNEFQQLKHCAGGIRHRLVGSRITDECIKIHCATRRMA
jgi:hypothetical protein